MPIDIGDYDLLLSLPIRMLIVSRKPLTDMFYQLPGHPLAQSSLHKKLTITPAQSKCFFQRQSPGLVPQKMLVVLRDDLVQSSPWMAVLLLVPDMSPPKHWALCSETGRQGFLAESCLLRGFT